METVVILHCLEKPWKFGERYFFLKQLTLMVTACLQKNHESTIMHTSSFPLILNAHMRLFIGGIRHTKNKNDSTHFEKQRLQTA